MKSPFKLISALLLFSIIGFSGSAQQKPNAAPGNLYSAGYASAFIGGLYDAWYPYKNLHQHGDFGLGAPAKLDGELIMLNGKLYKPQYTGKTSPVSDADQTPYAVVCFFKAKLSFCLGWLFCLVVLFKYLDSVLFFSFGFFV